jgi:serine/threonine-protein kinase RsbW
MIPPRSESHGGGPSSHSPHHHRSIELEIPNDVREIERVVDAVRSECLLMSFDRRQLTLNVPVALTEALSNAILRGNGDDPSKVVRIRAWIDASVLVVEVADQGPGFDIDACTIDPTTPEYLEGEQGRGLFLMRKLMDDVERYVRGTENIVRLTLRRAS